MATPQESITTVNGRRCTRSRARFVTTPTVISETLAVVAPTQVATSTVVEAPQIPTSSTSLSAPPPLSSSVIQLLSSSVEPPILASTKEPGVSSASEIAVPSSSSVVLSLVPSESIVATPSSIKTSIVALPELPGQSNTSSQPSAAETSLVELPQRVTNSVASGFPTGGRASVVAPKQSSGGDNGISITEIERIVGGTIGGVVSLALLGALLFLCLRKKRRLRGEKWDEKRREDSSFMTLVRAKMKSDNAGSTDYPYERHAQHPSVSSVYSTQPHDRSSSGLEGVYAAQGIVSVGRASNDKNQRRLSRKKPRDVTPQYVFPNDAENSIRQSNNGDQNPFADPQSPVNVHLSSHDLNQPLVPQPVAMPASRSPFASLLEEIEGAPNWLRDSAWSNHRRTQSSASALALNSHPPSPVYSTTKNPFMDPTGVPPLPSQPSPPTRARPSSNSYSGYPSLNPNISPASRESEFAFFGEPGPSRPTTRAFTPSPSQPSTNTFTPGRTARQSDPFDLDRPEVLGFRGVMSRMISVRKQPAQSRRTSSVDNWANATDALYGQMGRNSPGPGQLNR